jgi:hypothetical protein
LPDAFVVLVTVGVICAIYEGIEVVVDVTVVLVGELFPE